MSGKELINIFIPHYHKDETFIPKMKGLLEKRGYEVRDSSIDESEPNNAKNPDYIKSLLRPKIEWAGKIVVLIGPETHKREWVDWEIEYASSFGDKRIIGVFIQGATDADVPENLNKYGDALVPWNSEKLEAAIDGENIWLDSSNNPRTGVWPIGRSNC
ncbi:MAG TPA: hypothetical protein DDW50_08685 [Firmicutes bacterium]|jgi:hypothetical protein|nr:hypothetical protein [Bacillota bacterium]